MKPIELVDEVEKDKKLKVYRSQLVGAASVFVYVSPNVLLSVLTDIYAIRKFANELLQMVRDIEDERAKYYSA